MTDHLQLLQLLQAAIQLLTGLGHGNHQATQGLRTISKNIIATNATAMTAERDRIQATIRTDKKGTTCKACGDYHKIYARPLTAAHAAELARLRHLTLVEPHPRIIPHNDGHYLHRDHFMLNNNQGGTRDGGDFAKLLHYGLAVQLHNDDPGKKDSGEWAITQTGCDFLNGELTLCPHILLYKKDHIGWPGNPDFPAWPAETPIDIHQTLRNYFDYQKLMSGDINNAYIPPAQRPKKQAKKKRKAKA